MGFPLSAEARTAQQVMLGVVGEGRLSEADRAETLDVGFRWLVILPAILPDAGRRGRPPRRLPSALPMYFDGDAWVYALEGEPSVSCAEAGGIPTGQGGPQMPRGQEGTP